MRFRSIVILFICAASAAASALATWNKEIIQTRLCELDGHNSNDFTVAHGSSKKIGHAYLRMDVSDRRDAILGLTSVDGKSTAQSMGFGLRLDGRGNGMIQPHIQWSGFSENPTAKANQWRLRPSPDYAIVGFRFAILTDDEVEANKPESIVKKTIRDMQLTKETESGTVEKMFFQRAQIDLGQCSQKKFKDGKITGGELIVDMKATEDPTKPTLEAKYVAINVQYTCGQKTETRRTIIDIPDQPHVKVYLASLTNKARKIITLTPSNLFQEIGWWWQQINHN